MKLGQGEWGENLKALSSNVHWKLGQGEWGENLKALSSNVH